MRQTAPAIERVCVIGAGTMGTGIAAQIANAGFPVLLLDVAGTTETPNIAAAGGRERIIRSEPPLLTVPENINLIEAGNIRDDLNRISDCDWVVEAIVERLEPKRDLYRSFVPHLKTDALISSNTSTIPIALLMEDMPETLRRNFCITHFFNPVRYMRLVELVSGRDTSQQCVDRLGEFCDRNLGKGVVRCADTPGFLANRLGVYALQVAIHEATALGIPVEEADAIFGRPMGFPKTGVFGLYDLIGLDLMVDVVRSMRSILPVGDAFHAVGADNPLIIAQIEKGFTGNKGKGGFYAVIDGEPKSLDLSTGQWKKRNRRPPEIAVRAETEGIGALLEGHDRLSFFAWRVLAQVLAYAASLVPEVTQSAQDIDDAMKLGYNWVQGPFELMDTIGTEELVRRLEEEGSDVPKFLSDARGQPYYRVENKELTVRHWDGKYWPIELPPGATRFHMMRRTLEPVEGNRSASLYHLADDLRLVEFHSKANSLDSASMQIVRLAARDPGRGIIIHNDGQHFSAGVNLQLFLTKIEEEDWTGIDRFLSDFQESVHALLYCPVPVAGAPSGLALGGGFEVLLHCDCVIAHTNSVMGLVETLVGLVPGGGGVKETYLRWYQRTQDWQEAAWHTFNQIGYAKTATSPDLAARMGYFIPGRDSQVMNRDRLLDGARARIASMAGDYRPRTAPQFELAGSDTYDAMEAFLEEGRTAGKFLDHDVKVAKAAAWIVTGGRDGRRPATESEMFERERSALLSLAKTAETKARIVHLLQNGRPLRN